MELSNQESTSSQGPVALAEEFQASFNRIDTYLRKATGLTDRKNKTFLAVVAAFEHKHPGARADVARLRSFAELRNALVHEVYQRAEYIAYPTQRTLNDLLDLESKITSPLLARDVFHWPVTTLKPTDRVPMMLDLVKEHDFTQFPVYEDDKSFAGLVTSTGLVRWMARRPAEVDEFIDLDNYSIGDVLASEELTDNVVFMPHSSLVVDVAEAFSANSRVEAVIFNHAGSRNQAILGIATRWDVANQVWKRR